MKILRNSKIVNEFPENLTEMSLTQAIKILQIFHDDFYNEEKDQFLQTQLQRAIYLVLEEVKKSNRTDFKDWNLI